MKTVIVGSFTNHSDTDLADAIEAAELIGIVITEVLTGNWVGVDYEAALWAKRNAKPVTKYSSENGVIRRNKALVNDADALIVIWHPNHNEGFSEIIGFAKAKGIPHMAWRT